MARKYTIKLPKILKMFFDIFFYKLYMSVVIYVICAVVIIIVAIVIYWIYNKNSKSGGALTLNQ